jgi:hypothetical protein
MCCNRLYVVLLGKKIGVARRLTAGASRYQKMKRFLGTFLIKAF